VVEIDTAAAADKDDEMFTESCSSVHRRGVFAARQQVSSTITLLRSADSLSASAATPARRSAVHERSARRHRRRRRGRRPGRQGLAV